MAQFTNSAPNTSGTPSSNCAQSPTLAEMISKDDRETSQKSKPEEIPGPARKVSPQLSYARAATPPALDEAHQIEQAISNSKKSYSSEKKQDPTNSNPWPHLNHSPELAHADGEAASRELPQHTEAQQIEQAISNSKKSYSSEKKQDPTNSNPGPHPNHFPELAHADGEAAGTKLPQYPKNPPRELATIQNDVDP